jgi:hypothetical protein
MAQSASRLQAAPKGIHPHATLQLLLQLLAPKPSQPDDPQNAEQMICGMGGGGGPACIVVIVRKRTKIVVVGRNFIRVIMTYTGN